MRLKTDDMKDDVRKMSIALMIAGLVGYILDSVGGFNAATIVVIGLILWIVGLVEKSVQEEA